jgi:Kef-type K+ transport system membrane component KefB
MRVNMLVEILSNLLVVIGVCAGVFYFFFSKKHTGALGVVSKVGIAFLMMSFGASFGYTVMGRISLAIGRFQDLLAWPVMAGTALLVLIVALYLESRRARV